MDSMQNFVMPDEWSKNWDKHCPESTDSNVYEKSIHHISQFVGFAACIFGAWFDQNYLETANMMHTYDTDWGTSFVRFLCNLGIGVPFYIAAKLFIPKATFPLKIVRGLVSACIPAFMTFGLAKRVGYGCGVVNSRQSVLIGKNRK